MKCTRAREAIVLMATGDETPAERRRTESHLLLCDDCRRFAAEEPPSLALLKTSPPLHDADYAAIRARVRSQIEEPAQPRFRLLPYAWVAAVLALVFVASVFEREPERAPEVTRVPEISPPVVVTVPRPQPPEVATMESVPEPRPKRRMAKRAPVQVASHAPAESMRIHIQTDDPDVRIIWIVNSTQETESNLVKEKS